VIRDSDEQAEMLVQRMKRCSAAQQPIEESIEMPAKLFEIERAGETVVLIPQTDISEFAFQQLDAEGSEILKMLDQTAATNVVIDCHKTDFFGSIALGFFTKIWRLLRKCNRRMAFCNVSAHEKEILHVTKTDSLWSVCPSRSEALALVSNLTAR
jgi:anti-anti-sigma factor